MDEQQFLDGLAADGFLEVERKLIPAGTVNLDHSHAWDARLLVLDGEVTLGLDGASRRFAPGEVLEVARDQVHTEDYPCDTRLVIGRRHPPR